MEKRNPIRREEVDRRVIETEGQIAELFRHFDPFDIAEESARRFRHLESGNAISTSPPHCMIRAIEAACAYGCPSTSLLLPPHSFTAILGALLSADDPVMEHLIDQPSLMGFKAYIHRTQIPLQRRLWSVPIGRAEMLFADSHALPRVGAAFFQRFGLTPRHWVQIAFMAYAATGNKAGKHAFDDLYVEKLAESDIPVSAAKRFLSEVSLTPAQIGEQYRLLRYGNATTLPSAPWTWCQSPPILHQWPIMRFGRRWFVPAPSLLIPLFGELLFKRLAEVAVGGLREELSDRFTTYVASVFGHQIPGCRVLRERALRGDDGGKVCDLAVDLPNAILLIETKSVFFDRRTFTENNLVSGPAKDLIDGAIQVAETARRIVANRCPAAALDPKKPIVGMIATLGSLPQSNSDAWFDSGMTAFAKRRLGGPTLTPELLCRPFVLGPDALETLAIHLHADPANLPSLTEEKQRGDNALSDWPLFLNDKVQSREHNLSYWQEAFDRLIKEFTTCGSHAIGHVHA